MNTFFKLNIIIEESFYHFIYIILYVPVALNLHFSLILNRVSKLLHPFHILEVIVDIFYTLLISS